MSFLLKWILPTAVPLILEALVAVLRKLASDTSSEIDDNFVNVIDNEKENISVLLITQAKRMI